MDQAEPSGRSAGATHVLFLDQSSGYVDVCFTIIHQNVFVLCTSPVTILYNKNVFKWEMGSNTF